jgi:hypothetical protein
MMHRVHPALARAQTAYERARFVRALTQAWPALLVLGFVVAGGQPIRSASLGAAIAITLITCKWAGGSWAAGTLPGLLAGALPLLSALGARGFGHVCAFGACRSACLPTCLCSGLLAGLLLARISRHESGRARFMLAGAALVMEVGALGCVCVGYSSFAGVALGLTLPVARTLWQVRSTRA